MLPVTAVSSGVLQAIPFFGPFISWTPPVLVAIFFKPDVILLAHGAALSEPQDAQYMLDHTGCHGVQLGSSIERLAVEQPLERRAAAFKAVAFPAQPGPGKPGREGLAAGTAAERWSAASGT